MSNLFRFLFLLSFASYITCSQEIHLSCNGTSPIPRRFLVPNFTYCFVKEFKVTEKDATFVFDEEHNYTAVMLGEFKVDVFPAQIIDIFPTVTYFDVVYCGMTKVDDHAFKNASQVTRLHLAHNKLTEVTEFMFDGADNLEHLFLYDNKITDIHPKAFHSLTKLETLGLSLNKITAVDKDMFAPLKSLKELDLSSNKLSKIDPKLVSHNGKLELLLLGQNNFDTMEIELSTKFMRKLDISGHDIPKLTLRKSLETTNDATEIKELALRDCKISSFDDFNFDRKIRVKNFDLNSNEITSLVDTHELFPFITELDLTSNKITKMSPESVKTLQNLEILILSYNPLKTSTNMFEPLKNLKKLELKRISLFTIESEWFTGLSKLEFLDVSYNNMTGFDYTGLMNALPLLKRLEIERNYLTCSYLKQMVVDLKSIGRLDVLSVRPWGELEEVNEAGNIYGIFCEDV